MGPQHAQYQQAQQQHARQQQVQQQPARQPVPAARPDLLDLGDTVAMQQPVSHIHQRHCSAAAPALTPPFPLLQLVPQQTAQQQVHAHPQSNLGGHALNMQAPFQPPAPPYPNLVPQAGYLPPAAAGGVPARQLPPLQRPPMIATQTAAQSQPQQGNLIDL